MEKTVKHRFLNNALFTALIVPLAFFVLRDTIAVLTGLMFESMGGKESFLLSDKRRYFKAYHSRPADADIADLLPRKVQFRL